jgi:hypothetical protein
MKEWLGDRCKDRGRKMGVRWWDTGKNRRRDRGRNRWGLGGGILGRIDGGIEGATAGG